MQALEYSSSVDSAGAPTPVVTPSGETSTAPGAGVWVSELVEVVDAAVGDEAGTPSPPDEQPAIATAAAAATTQKGYRRIAPIYATLATVTKTGFLECCWA
jgi:hypothetical protein